MTSCAPQRRLPRPWQPPCRRQPSPCPQAPACPWCRRRCQGAAGSESRAASTHTQTAGRGRDDCACGKARETPPTPRPTCLLTPAQVCAKRKGQHTEDTRHAGECDHPRGNASVTLRLRAAGAAVRAALWGGRGRVVCGARHLLSGVDVWLLLSGRAGQRSGRERRHQLWSSVAVDAGEALEVGGWDRIGGVDVERARQPAAQFPRGRQQSEK